MIFSILFSLLTTYVISSVSLPLPVYENTLIPTNGTIATLSLEDIIKQQNMLLSSDKFMKMGIENDSFSETEGTATEEEYELDTEITEKFIDPLGSIHQMEYDCTNYYDDLIIDEDSPEYDESRDPQSYAFHFRQFLNPGN